MGNKGITTTIIVIIVLIAVSLLLVGHFMFGFLQPQATPIPTPTTPHTLGGGQLDTWKQTTDYPFIVQGPSCVTNQGYIYCVGGYNVSWYNDPAFNVSVSYKGEMNRTYYATISSNGVGPWIQTTDYPTSSPESCLVSSNYIYCLGDYNGSQEIPSAYYASLSSSGIGNWIPTNALPRLSRCMTDSGYIYCAGPHYNGTAYSLNEIDISYAPLSSNGIGNWNQVTELQNSTAGCSASGGYAYCFGGCDCPPPGGCSCPSYYASLSSKGIGAWSKTTDLPTAGWGIYVTADSYIYYFVNTIYYAHFSSNGISSWGKATPYPLYNSQTACASDGAYIYCIGLYSTTGANFINSVYFTHIVSE